MTYNRIQSCIGVYIDAIGTVTPVYTVSISSQVNGQIVTLNCTEGQLVRKGDPLIDIDSRPYRATILQAQGALERDEKMLAQAQMGLSATLQPGLATRLQSKSWMTKKTCAAGRGYRIATSIAHSSLVCGDDGTVYRAQLQLQSVPATNAVIG